MEARWCAYNDWLHTGLSSYQNKLKSARSKVRAAVHHAKEDWLDRLVREVECGRKAYHGKTVRNCN